MTRSMVFITTRQSSFRTRFSTVFSHTVANSVRLQIQTTGGAGESMECPLPGGSRLKASALPFLSECYSLAIQEIHERSQHTICILSHRGSGVRGCIPCAPYLAQDVSHLSNTLVDPHLEAVSKHHAELIQNCIQFHLQLLQTVCSFRVQLWP